MWEINFWRRLTDGISEEIRAGFASWIHELEEAIARTNDPQQKLALGIQLWALKLKQSEYERELISTQLTSSTSKLNETYQTLRKQQDQIQKFSHNSPVSHLKQSVQAILLSLLMMSGVAIYGQTTPKSSFQQWVSWLVGKIQGNQNTTYDEIQTLETKNILIQEQEAEKDKLIHTLQLQVDTQELLRTNQNNIIDVQTTIISNNQQCAALLSLEEVAVNGRFHTTKQNISSTQKVQTKDVHNSTIFADVQKLWANIMSEFSDKNIQLQITEGSWGVVHVNLVYNWKTSLGYHANSPKFKNRLTKAWMKAWINLSLNQEKQLEIIEKFGTWKGIRDIKNSPIYMESQRMYNSGNIILTFHDKFSNTDEKTTISLKDTDADIAKKIDQTLNKFLSVKM